MAIIPLPAIRIPSKGAFSLSSFTINERASDGQPDFEFVETMVALLVLNCKKEDNLDSFIILIHAIKLMILPPIISPEGGLIESLDPAV